MMLGLLCCADAAPASATIALSASGSAARSSSFGQAFIVSSFVRWLDLCSPTVWPEHKAGSALQRPATRPAKRAWFEMSYVGRALPRDRPKADVRGAEVGVHRLTSGGPVAGAEVRRAQPRAALDHPARQTVGRRRRGLHHGGAGRI